MTNQYLMTICTFARVCTGANDLLTSKADGDISSLLNTYNVNCKLLKISH